MVVRIIVASNSGQHPGSSNHITGYGVFGGYASLPIHCNLVRETFGTTETNVQICRIASCRRKLKGEWISRLHRGGMKRRCGVIVVASHDEIPLTVAGDWTEACCNDFSIGLNRQPDR